MYVYNTDTYPYLWLHLTYLSQYHNIVISLIYFYTDLLHFRIYIIDKGVSVSKKNFDW